MTVRSLGRDASPIGAIVVGTGFGCRVHVPALTEAGIVVRALVGRDAEKTARRAARAGVEQACTSIREAVEANDAELVVIATPPDTHYALALEAIAAGRHVLVEKPFTMDANEARQLVSAAESARVIGLVGHEFRFAAERVELARQLAAGVIGQPRLVTLIWHLQLAAPLDMKAPEWWFDRGRGGGWLGASVSHIIDSVHTWLGDIAYVNATLPMLSERSTNDFAEDSVVIQFSTESGCDGIIQQSASVWGRELEVMRVAGPDGTLEIRHNELFLATAEGEGQIDMGSATATPPSDDPRHRFTHLEFGPAARQASVIRMLLEGSPVPDGSPTPATFRDGLACVEVIDAVRRSATARGRRLRVRKFTR